MNTTQTHATRSTPTATVGGKPHEARPPRFLAEISESERLREAWRKVKQAHGAAGTDRVTVNQFAERDWRELAILQQELESGRYRPPALRRVLIPKEDGGHRVLGIPCVADRVAQAAAASVLQERFEPSFSDTSFAYRPGRDPRRAARRMEELLVDRGWAVIADVEKFFDNVDHAHLARLLRDAHVDMEGIGLIQRWLRAPIVDRGYLVQPVKGLPQGGPISPVLANLYLTEFDRVLESRAHAHVRFADDFVILARDEGRAREILTFISTWLWEHCHLRIKAAKTQYTPVTNGFSFVGFWFAPPKRLIPENKVARFRTEVERLFADPSRTTLVDIVEQHNALVRGWRNFYGGTTTEIDAQLVELDQWRRELCRQALARIHVDVDLGRLMFEELSRRPETLGPVDYVDPYDPTVLDTWYETDPWHVPQALARPDEVFSKPRALRPAVTAECKMPPSLNDGLLTVPTHASFLTKSHGLLVVRHKRQTVFECALGEVDHIVVGGQAVALSSSALIECARNQISLLLCAYNGQPLARVTPVRSETRPALLEQQIKARYGERGVDLAKALIAAKLHNQRALLLYYGKYARRRPPVRAALSGHAEWIAELLADCHVLDAPTPAALRTSLLLVEARAAAFYWSAIARLFPSSWGFPGRRHRGATDPVNMLLNYGYAILFTRVWRAVERHGLHAYVGFVHTSRRDQPGLVLDAMEQFRQPVVDRSIVGLLGRGVRIGVKRDGLLTLRTRRRIQEAIERTLKRPIRGTSGRSLSDEIMRQVGALRRALTEDGSYRGYRMPW